MTKSQMKIRANLLAVFVSIVVLLAFKQALNAQTPGQWECPKCKACVEPIKFGRAEPDKSKKSTTNYSMKCEDVCFAVPSADRNRISSFYACNFPSTWNAWCTFTGGIVREKRSLQKRIESTNIAVQKCSVHYKCPCCNEKFSPKE